MMFLAHFPEAFIFQTAPAVQENIYGRSRAITVLRVSPFSIAILYLPFILQYCVSIFYYNMFVALLCLPFVLQYCVFLLYRNIVPYLFQYCFRLLYCNIVPFLLQYWLRLLYFNIVPFLLQYWLRLLYCNIVTTIETAKSVQI